MTEDEARDLVRSMVDATGFDRLNQLATLVIEENERQNLIARSTLSAIWSRHILDSVQLLKYAGSQEGEWLDIGTGGGFPGLATAAATGRQTLLVEPRRLRASFLNMAADRLKLSQVRVTASRVESITCCAAIISARAVAPLEKLLRAAAHCATPSTRWLLPRGRMTPEETAGLERQFGLVFHVEQSLSDPSSSVVVVNGHPRP